MSAGFFGLPWLGWAGISLAVAVLYWFVWPKNKITETSGLRYFVLRYGHALVWGLIMVNFVLRAISPALSGIADMIALAGGLLYLLFMTMTFVVKK